MKYIVPGFLFVIISCSGYTQSKTDPFLENLIRNNASVFLKDILSQPDTFQYQVIYTQINRDKKNNDSDAGHERDLH